MSLSNTPTPHIGAEKGEIAETILLPGDPLRAKYIAEHFLEDVKQFNGTRNMLGYTGTYMQAGICHGHRNGVSLHRYLFL